MNLCNLSERKRYLMNLIFIISLCPKTKVNPYSEILEFSKESGNMEEGAVATLTPKTSAFLSFGQKNFDKNTFRQKFQFWTKFRPIFHFFGTHRNAALEPFFLLETKQCSIEKRK